VAKWDIAAAGILAGAVATVLVLFIGVAWSVPHPDVEVRIWRPLLWQALTGGLIAHPLLWAAWLGWVLTGISLLPIPGLDGGRILQATISGVGRTRSWLSAVWLLGGLAVCGL
jgi:membrane-associated protease RseP (regulator of RpoE activity)